MDITISPGKLSGSVSAIPSKSQGHRLLICAAFADKLTHLHCPETNRDMEATADCLRSLGAEIRREDGGYVITPLSCPPKKALLNCRDSGSTLRFLLPVAAALGVEASFRMEGRLPQRPLSPLWEELERMGAVLSRPTADTILCQGRLVPGAYEIDGGVSSQFISGLLFACALLPGVSTVTLTGKVESKPYIEMTQQAMARFGKSTQGFTVSGGTPFHSPGQITVEGDWSNAAFFLAAKQLGNAVQVENLVMDSPQGDRAALLLLQALEKEKITISAGDIPDLVPILSVAAACFNGAVFTDVHRLRLKESDRVASIIAMLQGLGGHAEATDDTLTVYCTGLSGGTVDACNDHRIAMSAAIAATRCEKSVTILGAECVQKSYPHFFDEYCRLGGCYEQYLR